LPRGQRSCARTYKNHKCVALARRQLAQGANGITCATLGEAEALAGSGIQGILVANEIAGAIAVERFVQLSRATDIIVGVDSEWAIPSLAAASVHAKVKCNRRHRGPRFSGTDRDRLELWAHYSDATVNLHRRMLGMRNGQVEETFIVEG
jgi:hypothetical protein